MSETVFWKGEQELLQYILVYINFFILGLYFQTFFCWFNVLPLQFRSLFFNNYTILILSGLLCDRLRFLINMNNFRRSWNFHRIRRYKSLRIERRVRMVFLKVRCQQISPVITFWTNIALIWFFIRMPSFMISLIAKWDEALVTLAAFERFFSIVNAEVDLQIPLLWKDFSTPRMRTYKLGIWW